MNTSAFGFRQFRKGAIRAFIYAAIIGISFYLAYETRFDFLVPVSYQNQRMHYIFIVIVLKLTGLLLAGQLGSMITYFGVTDLLRMIIAMTICGAILVVAHLASSQLFVLPRGALLVDYVLCLAGLCTARLGARLYRERLSLSQKPGEKTQRIAIVGAGDAGAGIAGEFLNSPRRGFKPVMFFDDDKAKHGQHVHGVRVVGAPERIAELKDKGDVSKIVIAMPSAPARRISEIVRLAQAAGLKVETLPSSAELASGRARASRIRPVEVQDLLGRQSVNLDSASIRKFIEGSVVLVTGAGGSIGSELCRQLAALDPKRLLMLDQSEGNLFLIEQELNELGLGTIGVPLVADILDGNRMEWIYHRYGPEVVFHAAAHKHVFMMERQPAEAIRNNVLGTRLVAKLAAASGVRTFVLISTDKAINPTSVMGATKRLAEIEIMAIHEKLKRTDTHFMAVRFGNVLGSSGSVIPIFKRQIANGGPVTVTHPDVTRYFMTIPEAVGLVLQTTVMGRGGEIFVLDMGQPMKIVDLARQMIELSGFKPDEDIEIRFTGLKPGEKLFEELRYNTEEYEPTDHPHVMRFVGKAELDEAALGRLEQALHSLEPVDVKRELARLVPGYTPYQE